MWRAPSIDGLTNFHLVATLAIVWLLEPAAHPIAGADGDEPAPPPIDRGLQERVDALIASYDPKGGGRWNTLLPNLLADEGRDAVPYLAWRLEKELAECERSPDRRELSPSLVLIEALGVHGDPRGRPALARALADRNRSCRQAAVRAIARIPGVESYRLLLDRLADESVEVASCAQEALVAMAEAGPKFDTRKEAVDAAKRNLALRGGVAQLLAHLGGEEATTYVRQLLADPDESLRTLAVQLLPRVDPDGGVDTLLDRPARDESLRVRKEACQVLGSLGAREAIEPLISLLEEEADPGLRGNALWALRQITGQPFPDDLDLWRTWWDMHRPK